MEEKWISTFNGNYEVSSDGRVRRSGAPCRGSYPGRILKERTSPNGYKLVQLCRSPGNAGCYVHRLVAEAFIGKRPPGYEINHKDGDKENNRASNLEYLTRKENIAHARKLGLLKRTPDPELVARNASIAKDRRENSYSGAELSEKYGLSVDRIWSILGKIKKQSGSEWVTPREPLAVIYGQEAPGAFAVRPRGGRMASVPVADLLRLLGITKEDCDEAFGDAPRLPSREDLDHALRGTQGLQVSGTRVLDQPAQVRFSGAICALKFAAGELTLREFEEELLRWA